MTTYPTNTGTVYPTWTMNTWPQTVTTTTQQVVDANSLASVISNIHQTLFNVQNQLHDLSGKQENLLTMLDWLCHNPGKTPEDYAKFRAVKEQIHDALSREPGYAEQNSPGL